MPRWRTPRPSPGGTGGAPGSTGRRPGPLARGELIIPLLAYAVLQVLVLGALLAVSPRFFWLDDQQAQFLPVFGFVGARLAEGRVPIMDIGSGAAGNYLADPQFGVLDPLHWVLSLLVSTAGDANVAAAALGVAAMLLLGTGIVVVGARHGAPPALSAAAAVGATSTGFYLWFGSAWWPSMLGLALLPWLWTGLTSTRAAGVLLTGASSWALGGSGHPYSLVLAGVLVAAWLVEVVRADGWGGVVTRRVVTRCAAGVAGLLAATPTLLAALEMAPATTRAAPESVTGNVGNRIPNALDTVLGGVTLTPLISGDFNGSVLLPPVAATFLLAVPALALVRWRAAVVAPGVVTALTMVGASLVLTQMPTYVATFRYPFRYLAAVGTWLPLLALVALGAAAVVTRRRLLLAGALVVAQLVLGVLRSPTSAGWHLAAAVLGLVALVALCVVVVPRRRVRRPVAVLAAAMVLGSGVAGPVLGLANTRSLSQRLEVAAGREPTGELYRHLAVRDTWDPSVDRLRAEAVSPGTASTLPVYERGPDRGWEYGVPQGNTALLVGQRTGFGYSAAGHRAWMSRWCADGIGSVGGSGACVDRLLAEAGGTGLTWLDLLAQDELVLQPEAPDRVREHVVASPTWERDGDLGRNERYRRVGALPGLVSWSSPGTSVRATADEDDSSEALAVLGRPFSTTSVTTGGDGGRLVLSVPAWPGLRASVDGEPLEVGAVDGTALALTLPPDLDDALVEVSFEPVGARLFPLLVPAAVVALLAATVVGSRGRGRERAPRASGEGSEQL